MHSWYLIPLIAVVGASAAFCHAESGDKEDRARCWPIA